MKKAVVSALAFAAVIGVAAITPQTGGRAPEGHHTAAMTIPVPFTAYSLPGKTMP